MEQPFMTFGAYVRQRREALGKTMRALAMELDISPAYLSDIEKGNRSAPERYLDKFAAALQITDPEELHRFYDLAGVSKNGQHSDINTYMDHVPSARVALRTAKDRNLSDEDWQNLIEIIKRKHN